jgi:hypothetical protein
MKEGAESISDFRPISLIHAVAKIITKAMAIRLAPSMQSLIAPSQSAFIKGQNIHDNYLYVRNIAHRWRTETVNQRGGSEWEPIKILFKNSAYEPKFTRAPPQASLAKFT